MTTKLLTPRLTNPQLRELRAIYREPQSTYGASRTRLQNTLVRLGFAKFVEVDTWDRCAITASGRAVIEEMDAAASARR